tara:strand:- start:43 stop:330 length:288 start_codon:yes stop_codon:yes gene_type:complete
MSKKTIKDLLKENNREIDVKELTQRGYNIVNDFLKLNKDGNLLDYLKETLNDEKDAHFLNRIIEKEIQKGFKMAGLFFLIIIVIIPIIIFSFILL